MAGVYCGTLVVFEAREGFFLGWCGFVRVGGVFVGYFRGDSFLFVRLFVGRFLGRYIPLPPGGAKEVFFRLLAYFFARLCSRDFVVRRWCRFSYGVVLVDYRGTDGFVFCRFVCN